MHPFPRVTDLPTGQRADGLDRAAMDAAALRTCTAVITIGTTLATALAARPELSAYSHLCVDTDTMVRRLGLHPAATLHLALPWDFHHIAGQPEEYPELTVGLFTQYLPLATAAGTGGAPADAGAIATTSMNTLVAAINQLVTTALPAPALHDRQEQDAPRNELRVLIALTLAGGSQGLLLPVLLALRTVCGIERGISLLIDVHTALPEITGDEEDRAIARRIAHAAATLVSATALHGAPRGCTLRIGHRLFLVPPGLVDRWYLHAAEGGTAGHRTPEDLARQVAEVVLLSADRTRGIGVRLEQDRPRTIRALRGTSGRLAGAATGTAPYATLFSAAGVAVATKGTALLAALAAAADTRAWLARWEQWALVASGQTDPSRLLVHAFGPAAQAPRDWALALRTDVVPDFTPAPEEEHLLLRSIAERARVLAWYKSEYKARLRQIDQQAPAVLDRIQRQYDAACAALSPIPTVALGEVQAIQRFLEELVQLARGFCSLPQTRAAAFREADAQLDDAHQDVEGLTAARDSFLLIVRRQLQIEARVAWWQRLYAALQRLQEACAGRIRGLTRFARALQGEGDLAAREALDPVLRAAHRASQDRCFFTLRECEALAAAAPLLAANEAGVTADLHPGQAAALLEALAADPAARAAALRGDLTTYLQQVYQHRLVAHTRHFAAHTIVELLATLYPDQGACRRVLAAQLRALGSRAQPLVTLSEAELVDVGEQPLTEAFIEVPGGDQADPALRAVIRAELPDALLVPGLDGAEERLVVWRGRHGISLPMLSVFTGAYVRALLARLKDQRDAPVWFSPAAEDVVARSGLLPHFTRYDVLQGG